MAVHNASIAETLRHVADLLEIEGANPFRIRAYRRAAQTVEDLPQSAAKMVADGKTLVGLPGIGKDLAGKITEIVKTGRLEALTEIEARTPTTLAALTTIPGLGPKRVHRLHEAFGIKTLKDLEVQQENIRSANFGASPPRPKRRFSLRSSKVRSANSASRSQRQRTLRRPYAPIFNPTRASDASLSWQLSPAQRDGRRPRYPRDLSQRPGGSGLFHRL